MFASENLLFHEQIATLELKGSNVRWYVKEVVLSDRAFYLYKQNSNYVSDAHQRLTINKYKAQKPKRGSDIEYETDLPPYPDKYTIIVELLSTDNGRKKIVACQNDESANKFIKVFNLVAAFTDFDESVSKVNNPKEGMLEHLSSYLCDKVEMKRISQWVQNFVLNMNDDNNETFKFVNENVHSIHRILSLLLKNFEHILAGVILHNNNMNDAAFQVHIVPQLQNFHNLQKLEITNNFLSIACLEYIGRLFHSCQ